MKGHGLVEDSKTVAPDCRAPDCSLNAGEDRIVQDAGAVRE